MLGVNNSIVATFRGECFTVSGSREEVQFQCSIAGREFAPCECKVSTNNYNAWLVYQDLYQLTMSDSQPRTQSLKMISSLFKCFMICMISM